MTRRISFFFKKHYWRELALAGVVLEILAAVFWQSCPRFAGVLAGVGGSILATVIVTFAGPAGEQVYQSFLRLGVTRFWSDRSKVDGDEWVEWLKSTQMRCILFGHAHGNWLEDRGFETALAERLAAGKNVEIFFLDPTGAGAALRQREDSLGLRNTLGACPSKTASSQARMERNRYIMFYAKGLPRLPAGARPAVAAEPPRLAA